MILLIVFVCDLSKKYNTSTNAFRLCRCILKRMSSAWLASFCCWSSFRFLSSPPLPPLFLYYFALSLVALPPPQLAHYFWAVLIFRRHTRLQFARPRRPAWSEPSGTGRYVKWVKPRFGSEAIHIIRERTNQPTITFLVILQRITFSLPPQEMHPFGWMGAKWDGLN